MERRGFIAKAAIGIALLFILPTLAAQETVSITDPTEPKAQEILGEAFANGTNGHPRDDSQAVYWFRKAAEQGNADAQNNLGAAYAAGRGGLEKDDSQAMFWYQKAAQQGCVAAQYNLGATYEMYSKLRSAPQDGAQETFWYQKAAQQGYPAAQEKLGEMYAGWSGELAQDYSQAVVWWRKAADQGFADAQYHLGVSYAYGQGGLAKDDSQAVFWWQKAAVQGQVGSEDQLGVMYEQGRGGLSKSPAKAQYWYEKAAAQGDQDASRRLGSLEYSQTLSQEESQKCSPLMKRHAVIAARLHVGQTQQQVKAILSSEGFDISSVDGGSLRRLYAPGPWICRTLVGGGSVPGQHFVECLAYRNGIQEFGFDFCVSQTYRDPDTGELHQVKVDKLTQIVDQCSRKH